MDKIEAYEFAGIIAPGAVTIFGLSRIYPELGLLMNDDKISFGEFGLLLILAYVTGHLIQALGNLREGLVEMLARVAPRIGHVRAHIPFSHLNNFRFFQQEYDRF
jgi:hypothetical protein